MYIADIHLILKDYNYQIFKFFYYLLKISKNNYRLNQLQLNENFNDRRIFMNKRFVLQSNQDDERCLQL